MFKRIFLGDYYITDSIKPTHDIFVKSPIEWVKLDEKDGICLLYSKDVLDWEMYSDDTTRWNETWINKYLCEKYDEWFSKEEKDCICKKEHGQLFFLSEEEIKKYFPNAIDRTSVMYSVDKDNDGKIDISMEHYFYWLRANDDDCVDSIPSVNSLGEIVNRSGDEDEVGVRVAMWVDKKRLRYLNAKKGYNKYHHIFWTPEEI